MKRSHRHSINGNEKRVLGQRFDPLQRNDTHQLDSRRSSEAVVTEGNSDGQWHGSPLVAKSSPICRSSNFDKIRTPKDDSPCPSQQQSLSLNGSHMQRQSLAPPEKQAHEKIHGPRQSSRIPAENPRRDASGVQKNNYAHGAMRTLQGGRECPADQSVL